MLDTIIRHKMTAVLVVLVVIGVAWYELSSGPATPTTVLSTSAAGGGPDQQLVTTLLTLRTVTLAGTILTDPAFRSLQDFTTQITAEPVGRPDPFAPVVSSAPVTPITNSPAAKNTKLFAPKQ